MRFTELSRKVFLIIAGASFSFLTASYAGSSNAGDLRDSKPLIAELARAVSPSRYNAVYARMLTRNEVKEGMLDFLVRRPKDPTYSTPVLAFFEVVDSTKKVSKIIALERPAGLIEHPMSPWQFYPRENELWILVIRQGRYPAGDVEMAELSDPRTSFLKVKGNWLAIDGEELFKEHRIEIVAA